MWKFDEGRICIARESRSKSRAELAALTGLNSSQIIAWENGDVQPGQDSLMKICNALKIEPKFFFVFSGSIGNDSLPVE